MSRPGLVFVVVSILSGGGAVEAETQFSSLANSIKAVDPSNATLNELADLLNSVAIETHRQLGPELRTVFQQETARRVSSLVSAASQQLTREYKAAILEQRLLELCGQIAVLPNRRLPDSSVSRTAAANQLKSAVDAMKNGKGQIHDEVLSLATELPIAELERAASDLFHRGYGRPLEQPDANELNGIISSLLAEARAVTEELDSAGLPPGRRMDVARSGVKAREKVASFLDSLDQKHETPNGVVDRLAAWNAAHEKLNDDIAEHLAQSTNAEISAMQTRSTAHAEERQAQDRPQAIDARMEKENSQRRHEAERRFDHSASRRWPLYVLNGCVVAAVVAWMYFSSRRVPPSSST